MGTRQRHAAEAPPPSRTTKRARQRLIENLAIRVPSGFHDVARRAVGLRMARTGKRITQGELLMELLEHDVAEHSGGRS